jgi:hypothetical protein
MIQPDDYALVIGVDEYPNYKSLNGPVHDAREFEAWLKDTATGGGLPETNCHLLLNPEFPVGEITETLSTIIAQINQVRADGRQPRRFYLYFSGHGQANRIDEINLCLKKWSSTTLSRLALSARECWTEMVNCAGFAEVAIFLDCCRVWVASAGGMSPGINCPIPNPFAAGTRTFQAFSSEFLRKSFEGEEVAPDGDGDPVYSGYFTRVLLAGLKGAAAVPPGGVTQEALKQYLEAEVPRLALADKNITQTPVVEPLLLPGATFGSAQPITQSKLTIEFTPGRLGPIVLVMPTGDEIPVPDWSQPWQPDLSKGLYLLVDRGQDPEAEKPFRIPEASHVTF